jgi:hypothetical protein
MSERTALYRCYDREGTLLYIGVAKHFGLRWSRHKAKAPWWDQVHRQTVEWCDSRPEALAAEAAAIFTEQPKYNVVHIKGTKRRARKQAAQPVVVSEPAVPKPPVVTLGPGVTQEMVDRLDAFDLACELAEAETRKRWSERRRREGYIPVNAEP